MKDAGMLGSYDNYVPPGDVVSSPADDDSGNTTTGSADQMDYLQDMVDNLSSAECKQLATLLQTRMQQERMHGTMDMENSPSAEPLEQGMSTEHQQELGR